MEPTLFDDFIDEKEEKAKNRWRELTQLLHKYQQAYENDNPIVSDQEYDQLYKELQKLEEKFGVLDNSPTINIGFNQNELSSTKTLEDRAYIKHLYPMLSLDHQIIDVCENEQILEGVKFFIEKINRFLGVELNKEYVMIGQPKIDGVSISLHYNHGEFKTAALRGNGVEGEDVTDNILRLSNIPKNITYKKPIDIRGELFMGIKRFESLAASGVNFASPRHAASGTARLLDPILFAQRGLDLYIHGFAINDDEFFEKHSYMDMYSILEKDGFPMMPTEVLRDTKAAVDYFAQLCKSREKLDFLIDGVVCKLNDLSLYSVLSHSAKAPRYAFALKFPAVQAISTIVDIKWQVGRTGVVTPVIEIEEKNVGGVNIRFITMHNASEFCRHSPGKGDVVTIERAGDVIPAIVCVKKAKNDINEELPETCPSCNAKIVFDDKFLYCKNSWQCAGQVIAKLMHFVSRDAMDIDGLGEQRLKFLYEKNLLLYPDDIFTLFSRADEKQFFLADLKGWGKKSADKLYDQIEKARQIEFSRFLYALGIDGVGKNIAQKIASMCSNWNEFLAWIPSAEKIDGIGVIMQEKILSFVEMEKFWIERLLKHIEIITLSAEQTVSQYTGKSVVFTGTFSLSRQAMKEIAVKKGFQVKDTISTKVDYLVYGVDPGSKLKKAIELGISALQEDEWNSMING